MPIRPLIQGSPTYPLQSSPSLKPHILPAGRFSQCGGFQRVTFLEIFSPTEIFVKTENRLRLRIQPHDNSLQQVDEKSLTIYLQNIALQVSSLSDGSFKLLHHVTGPAGGGNSSKPEGRKETVSNKPPKKPSLKTLNYEQRKTLWYCLGQTEKLDINLARKTLKHVRYTEDSFYRDEQSFLVDAAEIGNLEGVKLLIEKGCNPNSVFRFTYEGRVIGCTPALIRAVESGHLAIVQFLVESGADIDLGDTLGDPAIVVACQKGEIKIAQYLITRVKNMDAVLKKSLEGAIYGGHIQVVELLLSHGAIPKEISPDYIQKTSAPIKKLLVEKGIGSEVPQKIANKVVRDLKVDHGFTKDQADKFHPLTVNALSKSEFMLSLLDESKPENIAATKALAEGLVAEILRFQKNLGHLTDADLEEGLKEVLVEVKSRDFSSKPAQPAPAPSAVVPAAAAPAAAPQPAAAPTVVYQPVVRVQQAPPAPRSNNAAQNMQAAAQVINAFASAENGMANLVNAFGDNS